MKKINLTEFNRQLICPILSKNEWDYSSKPEINKLFSFGMKEIFKWYYKRGNQISESAISTIISRYKIQNLNILEPSEVESEIRNFTKSILYQNLDHPFYNYSIELEIQPKLIFQHKIPVMARYGEKIYILEYSNGKIDNDLFLNRLETMVMSLWLLENTNELPVFVNIYYENNKIINQKFKTTLDYMTNIKKRLIAISKKISYPSTIPSWEICKGCFRRNECQSKDLLQKKKKPKCF